MGNAKEVGLLGALSYRSAMILLLRMQCLSFLPSSTLDITETYLLWMVRCCRRPRSDVGQAPLSRVSPDGMTFPSRNPTLLFHPSRVRYPARYPATPPSLFTRKTTEERRLLTKNQQAAIVVSDLTPQWLANHERNQRREGRKGKEVAIVDLIRPGGVQLPSGLARIRTGFSWGIWWGLARAAGYKTATLPDLLDKSFDSLLPT